MSYERKLQNKIREGLRSGKYIDAWATRSLGAGAYITAQLASGKTTYLGSLRDAGEADRIVAWAKAGC